MNFLLKTASAEDVEMLNASKISPILNAILRCAATSTKNGCKPRALTACCAVIQTCIDKGIDLSIGMPITGTRWALPLVIAARYSMLSVVALILDAGEVPPDSADSDGITPFHAAFSNPSNSGKVSIMRDVDVQCVEMFIQRGLVTSKRIVWESAKPGSKIYVGVQDLSKQSCLYTSIVYKNFQMASILVNQLGARMTDTSFHMLYADRKSRRNITRLLPIVVYVAKNKRTHLGHVIDIDAANKYDKSIAWSFPPTFYRGVFNLMQCWTLNGLPGEILRTWLVPFFGREHFFGPFALTNLPNPLLASLRPNFHED